MESTEGSKSIRVDAVLLLYCVCECVGGWVWVCGWVYRLSEDKLVRVCACVQADAVSATTASSSTLRASRSTLPPAANAGSASTSAIRAIAATATAAASGRQTHVKSIARVRVCVCMCARVCEYVHTHDIIT